MHDCFTRELMPGARVIDPDPGVLTSPCDAIVGACGPVAGTTVFQAKGFPYRMEELFGPGTDTTPFRDGRFITLRLTSAMYHRFHAPHDCDVSHVSYISGDTWNVNPIALKRVEKLFCRNERAVLSARLRRGNHPIAIVPVAAILVASIRLKFTDVLLHLKYRGPNEIPVEARFSKGEEMGGFQHGSTIIVFVPPGFEFVEGIATGARIRMGQALMKLPPQAHAAADVANSGGDAGTGARLTPAARRTLARRAGVVLACALVTVALEFVLRDLSLAELEAAFLRQPAGHVVACLALTAASFTCLALYDLVGVRVAAPGKVRARLALLSGATSAAIANTLGFHAVSGSAVRAHLYLPAGLSGGEVARVVSMSWLSLFAGNMTMLAGAELFQAATATSPRGTRRWASRSKGCCSCGCGGCRAARARSRSAASGCRCRRRRSR